MAEPSLAELQTQAEERGLPKYGTKAEIAERIAAYDAEHADPALDDGVYTDPDEASADYYTETEIREKESQPLPEDVEQVDDDTYVSAEPDAAEPDEPEDDEPESEPDEDEEPEPEPHRAGGYVDTGDGQGWVLDPEPEPVGPEPPVEAGSGGLPGNPVMSAAGWSLPKDE